MFRIKHLSFYTFHMWNQFKRTKEGYCIDIQCDFLNLIMLLAHLRWKLKWAFLIAWLASSVCLSVRLSVRLWTFHIFDFFSRTTGPISTKLGTKHPWVKRIQVRSNEGPRPFPSGYNKEIVKIHWRTFKLPSPEPVGQFQPKSKIGWRMYNFYQWRASHFSKGR